MKKINLGFDEVYVVTIDENELKCECVYDSDTADKKVIELQKSGYNKAEKITLEYAFENGYLSC